MVLRIQGAWSWEACGPAQARRGSWCGCEGRSGLQRVDSVGPGSRERGEVSRGGGGTGTGPFPKPPLSARPWCLLCRTSPQAASSGGPGRKLGEAPGGGSRDFSSTPAGRACSGGAPQGSGWAAGTCREGQPPLLGPFPWPAMKFIRDPMLRGCPWAGFIHKETRVVKHRKQLGGDYA